MKILNRIIKGQDMSMGPYNYDMAHNLFIVETLQVFEQKTHNWSTEININYKLVMKDLITQFFPTKGAPAPENIPTQGALQASQHQDTQTHMEY